jgi:metal-dependent amidase/aminoacylase/carboxypeptidase family protein
MNGHLRRLAPMSASLNGLGTATQDVIEDSMREIAAGVASAHNLTVDVCYERRLPVTINDPRTAELAASCAKNLFWATRVQTDLRPSMAGNFS